MRALISASIGFSVVLPGAIADPPPRAFDIEVLAHTRLAADPPAPAPDFADLHLNYFGSYLRPELADRAGALFGAELFDDLDPTQRGQRLLVRAAPGIEPVAQEGEFISGLGPGETLDLVATNPLNNFFAESDAAAAFTAEARSADGLLARRVVFLRHDDGTRSVLLDPWDPPSGVPEALDIAGNFRGRDDAVAYGRDGTLAAVMQMGAVDSLVRVRPGGVFGDVIAATGDPAPVPSDDEGEFLFSEFSTLGVSPGGRILFDAALTHSITGAFSSAIFVTTSGATLQTIAYEGQDAPGFGPGLGFGRLIYPQGQSSVVRPLFAGEDRVVFFASVRDGANPPIYALFENHGANLSRLRAEGDPVPGPDNPVLSYLGDFQTDTDGNVVYLAWIEPVTDDPYEALFEIAPDGTERQRWSKHTPVIDFFPIAATPPVRIDIFTITFIAPLPGGLSAMTTWAEDTIGSGYALQMTDRIGRPRLILRRGDTLEVAPGDLRVVRNVFITPADGYDHGRGSSFDASGRLLAIVEFDDQTQAMVLVTPNAAFCPANINGDGVLDFGDLGAFIEAFVATDVLADYNLDGIVDFGDISTFLALFLDGC